MNSEKAHRQFVWLNSLMPSLLQCIFFHSVEGKRDKALAMMEEMKRSPQPRMRNLFLRFHVVSC